MLAFYQLSFMYLTLCWGSSYFVNITVLDRWRHRDNDISHFKNSLKTHLFRLAFEHIRDFFLVFFQPGPAPLNVFAEKVRLTNAVFYCIIVSCGIALNVHFLKLCIYQTTRWIGPSCILDLGNYIDCLHLKQSKLQSHLILHQAWKAIYAYR